MSVLCLHLYFHVPVYTHACSACYADEVVLNSSLNLNVIMPAEYSEDLRWRAVWLHLIRGWNADEIADVLFVRDL